MAIKDYDFEQWKSHVLKNVVPKIENSNVFVSILSDFKTDAKFAVEIGFAIMYDKPIVVVVKPGVKVPDKLVRIADRIVELDVNDEDSRNRLAENIRDLIREI
jgi:nucleoside 2-deoxyribosyltransferase